MVNLSPGNAMIVRIAQPYTVQSHANGTNDVRTN